MNSSRPLLKTVLGTALLVMAGVAQASTWYNLTTQVLPNYNPPGPGNYSATAPAATAVINGATYSRDYSQPTGTGYIDPFVRVGMQGSAGKDMVQAYNTTVDGVLNNSNEDNWNHEITFGQLQILGTGENTYVRFLLDINQNKGGTGELLNLDDVQIFLSGIPNQGVTGVDPAFVTSGTAKGQVILADTTLVYRMDLPSTGSVPVPCDVSNSTCDSYDGSNRVTLDYSLNSGSGSGDMVLDIPVAMFTSAMGLTLDQVGQLSNKYIYLYSRFGSNPYNNNDGFEEWAFLSKTDDGGGFSGAPEPSTMLLAGLAILAARRAYTRRQA